MPDFPDFPLIEGLTAHNITITREAYATSGKDDARLFGVLDLLIPDVAIPDFGMSLGIRGSNDRSLAIQATAGARVFVCDNLAFSGDSGTVVLKKKHASGLDLRKVVPPAIDLHLEKAGAFVLDIEMLKNIQLSDAGCGERWLGAGKGGWNLFRGAGKGGWNLFRFWRCEMCDRVYWSAELAVECCQPEVTEFDDNQAMNCPTCGGEGNFNQHTEHDVNGKPFEMSDECDLCLGSGVVLKCDAKVVSQS